MAKYFIHRPIFAWVIAFLIMLAGLLSILNLPIAQYPRIAPPAISITATYPGASAKTIEDSVTQIIETKMSFSRIPVAMAVTPCMLPAIRFWECQNKIPPWP
jgi:multidrug efflux pump subunit AcrB